MDKRVALAEIEAEMVADAALPLTGSANLVFGEGNADCKVMFIGEAPGVNEDRLRRPFVGRGGQLLDTMIRDLGWKREDVYITNIVKRRPPDNRDPLPAEIEAYKPYLARQIAAIDPPLIVTLGRFSMNYFLLYAKMTRDHGRPLTIDGRTVYPVYHPAAALRSTQMMDTLRGDFARIPDVLAGKIAVKLPDAFDVKLPPAMAAKPKPDVSGKPQQKGLF